MSDPLDPQRWQKLTELFDRLVGLAAEERSAQLAELCGDDEALRAQAEALLREADVEGVLDDPGAEVLANWLEEIEASAREEALGQRVGPYRLVEELGRGGMGVVYLAERADGAFFYAEDYHQQYLDKNRGPGAYCPDHRTGVKLPDDFVVTPLQYVD